ncbi:MAG: hypothetical protein P8M30_12130 [Planctomycetaceae bacterium]|nr:hypothetical protein [Planctomycetaceae bacterium]
MKTLKMMTTRILPYNSVRDFAVHLKNTHFSHRHLLPWNRFDTGKSQWWWLSAEPANPVFHLSKIVIAAEQSWIPDGEVFVGLNVEKGLSELAAPRQTEIMQDGWYWNRFVEDMANESFQKAYSHAKNVFLLTGLSVESSEWGHCLLEMEKDKLSELESEGGDNEAIIQEFVACQNVEDLKTTLTNPKATDYEWRWVLVAIGQFFTLDPTGSDDTPKCVEMINAFHAAIRD